MKLVSFIMSNISSYGILLSDNLIIDIGCYLKGEYPDLKSLLNCKNGLTQAKACAKTAPIINASYVSYLPVIPNPNKILCVGMNYAEKRKEFDATSEDFALFVRFADSQVGHLSTVLKPKQTEQFDYEGELAIIIGSPCFRVSKEYASKHIAGYSCYMDGSVRDWQHDWFTAGKNWPKTGALGPCLTTPDEIKDFDSLTIKTFLNHQEVQSDKLGNLVHKVPEIIAYINTFTQLSAGDVILTGSPGGVGKKRNPPIFMKSGDLIEVKIEKIGHLINTVISE